MLCKQKQEAHQREIKVFKQIYTPLLEFTSIEDLAPISGE